MSSEISLSFGGRQTYNFLFLIYTSYQSISTTFFFFFFTFFLSQATISPDTYNTHQVLGLWCWSDIEMLHMVQLYLLSQLLGALRNRLSVVVLAAAVLIEF